MALTGFSTEIRTSRLNFDDVDVRGERSSDDKCYLTDSVPSGDGADAFSNIKDTCNGEMAKRSSYSCSSGIAPGGTVCLQENILKYIKDSADQFGEVQVNSIAGACHSTPTYHYNGTAVDFQIKTDSPFSSWMKLCAVRGAVENVGPGDPGHSTHTHCAFNPI
ncbi:uncharacterized protein LOC144441298 [Glandiceps talaboti]